MTHILTCPNGHAFSESSGGLLRTAPHFCPICGAAYLDSDVEVQFNLTPPDAGPMTFTSADRAPAPLPSLPGYELLDLLGSGGMGTVYRALQCSLNRIVALKMLKGRESPTPAMLARFRIEAESVACLD